MGSELIVGYRYAFQINDSNKNEVIDPGELSTHDYDTDFVNHSDAETIQTALRYQGIANWHLNGIKIKSFKDYLDGFGKLVDEKGIKEFIGRATSKDFLVIKNKVYERAYWNVWRRARHAHWDSTSEKNSPEEKRKFRDNRESFIDRGKQFARKSGLPKDQVQKMIQDLDDIRKLPPLSLP